ncbi:MAG: NUDIX domain-containing protein [Marinifilaceae bacterium]
MQEENKDHPLALFKYCPKCGSEHFYINNEKSKKCGDCGFIYYFNPSAAVVALIRNKAGELLVARRANNPGKGMLDMPGGFVDMDESGEEAVTREVKEETGLTVKDPRFLFSIPNIYPYSGFVVHTVDMFYECHVDCFDDVKAQDDVDMLVALKPEDINCNDFAFISIKEGLERYLNN